MLMQLHGKICPTANDAVTHTDWQQVCNAHEALQPARQCRRCEGTEVLALQGFAKVLEFSTCNCSILGYQAQHPIDLFAAAASAAAAESCAECE
jgi:hypothetical protein